MQIKVHIKFNVESSRTGIFLSAFTFGVIPTMAMNYYFMDVEVTNLKNKQSWSYHFEDSASIYSQTILILIAPFNWPFTVRDNIQKNMFKHLAVKTHEEGVLNTAQ